MSPQASPEHLPPHSCYSPYTFVTLSDVAWRTLSQCWSSQQAARSCVAPTQHINELLMEHSAPAKSQGMFSREQVSPRWGQGAGEQPSPGAQPRQESRASSSPGVSLPPSIPHQGETSSMILAEGEFAALLTFQQCLECCRFAPSTAMLAAKC